MKRIGARLTLVTALAWGAAPAHADDPLAGLAAGEIAKLRSGEIVLVTGSDAGDHAKHIRAAVVFELPPERAYEILAQPEHEDEYLDDCDEAVLIERAGGRDTVEYRVSVLLSTIRYRVNHTYHPAEHRFLWRLDPTFDNDLKVVEGEWRLYAWEGKTLARFSTRVDVSSLVPDFIQRRLAGSDVPRSLAAVRKRVNSGGAWRKD